MNKGVFLRKLCISRIRVFCKMENMFWFLGCITHGKSVNPQLSRSHYIRALCWLLGALVLVTGSLVSYVVRLNCS